MMERLTEDMITDVKNVLVEIDAVGGIQAAIESDTLRETIAKSAYDKATRIESGEDVVVGVNRFVSPDRKQHSWGRKEQTTGPTARESQLQSLEQLKHSRDTTRATRALHRLAECAAQDRCNLVEPTIEAMRSRCTVGEVSQTLANVFGRYQSDRPLAAVPKQDCEDEEILELIAAFRKRNDRAPRAYIVKLGLDGHDRGARIIGRRLSELGFDVISGPLMESPLIAARRATRNGCDLIGISCLSGAHLSLTSELLSNLVKLGESNPSVYVGGIVVSDQHELEQLGVRAVFGPGTPMNQCAKTILRDLLTTSRARSVKLSRPQLTNDT